MPTKGMMLYKGNSSPIFIDDAKSPEISENINTKVLKLVLIIQPLFIDRGYFYSTRILF